MSRDAFDQLVERWMEDTAFRSAVRTDPEGAIKAMGIELTDVEWQAVRNVDWTLTDEELTARASKNATMADGC